MTDQFFAKQDFVPDDNLADSLSDARRNAAETIMPRLSSRQLSADVQEVRELLQTLVENPNSQHSVTTGLTNYVEAIFPRTQVIWEQCKTGEGKPFIHLHQQIVWQHFGENRKRRR